MNVARDPHVELHVPASRWTKEKSKFDDAGFQLTGRPVDTNAGPQIEFVVAWVHWPHVKKILEEKNIPYSVRDLNVEKPVWKNWP
jgi:hypothetical protein